jgi:flagellin
MALSISTNIASLNAQRSLSHSQAGLSTTMQRLSSGLRVNSAKDDAAGLAISERMFSQVRGMQQAARNANDGISMLQTAEGSIGKVGDMLQRMRELAVQSINFTNSDQDRQALQGEVAQLKREIDRIGISSQFNGEYIFAPSRTKVVGSGDPSIEAAIDGLQGGWLENAEAMIKQYFGIEATGQTIKFEFTDSIDGAGGVAARVWSSVGASGPGSNIRMELDMADFTSSTSLDGGSGPVYYDRIIAHEMTHAIMATGQSWGSCVPTPATCGSSRARPSSSTAAMSALPPTPSTTSSTTTSRPGAPAAWTMPPATPRCGTCTKRSRPPGAPGSATCSRPCKPRPA